MDKMKIASIALEVQENMDILEEFRDISNANLNQWLNEFATKFLARVRDEEGKEAVGEIKNGYFRWYQSVRSMTDGHLFLHPQEEQWISVEDRLPKHYEEVLVYPPPTDFCMTASYGSFKGLLTWKFVENEAGFGYVDYMCNPTHWMPIPKPPAAKEQA